MNNQFRLSLIHILIRRIKVLEFAKKKVLVFKPAIDNRYSETKVVSHAGSEVDSIVIREAKEILNYVDDSVDVIAIDEVQLDVYKRQPDDQAGQLESCRNPQ